MSIPGGVNPLLLRSAAAAGGYTISRSLRFSSIDSAYLSRTPASAGNRKTWTWAGWVKRSKLASNNGVLLASSSATWNNSNSLALSFIDTDQLYFYAYSTGYFQTQQLFRDTSAWYHIVFAFDSTQSVATDRAKLYVNGSLVTQYSYENRSAITQNADFGVNAAHEHRIGSRHYDASVLSDLYLADIHFIDGQALTPSSFTEVSATTGRLEPKQYVGSFGTNGFWLPFSDTSSTTSGSNAGIGKDFSGNGNYWNSNNLSVTAGSGLDLLVDTPTSYGIGNSGGDVRGNYCTWNPLTGNLPLRNGNLDAIHDAGDWKAVLGTIAVSSGKWYWEITSNTDVSGTGNSHFGIALLGYNALASNTYIGNTSTSYAYRGDGTKYTNNTATSYGSGIGNGTVVGVALDLDAGTLTFYNNGVSQGTAFSSLSGTFFPAVSHVTTSSSSANFGQRAFAYTPPANHKALVDTNLPSPVVAKPSTVMDVLTWTGNGANGRSITGLNFSPDFVWIKNRLNPSENSLFDTVRGASKTLYSNQTAAELASSDFGHISSFDSAGFTLANGASGPYPNLATNWNGSPIVGWCFDAGSNTVSNTQGSITTSLRVSPSSGFAVVTYTGNGSTGATIGHSLGIAPRFVIFKARSISENWNCYHASLGASQLIALNTTNAASSTNDFNNTAPTSSVITLGSGTGNNGNGTTYVAYCFAPVAGYSSMSTWTGNGSSDGPMVWTGFRPRWLLFKETGGTGSWGLIDSARSTYNVTSHELYANLSDAEYAVSSFDFLSNGFKLRTSSTAYNGSGKTFIFAAFAESPFQYARAR